MREAQKMKRDELQRAADRFGAQAAAADKVAKEAEETVQSAKSRSRAMKKEAHEKDKDYGPLLLFVEKSRHAEETAEKEKILAEKSEEPAAITIAGANLAQAKRQYITAKKKLRLMGMTPKQLRRKAGELDKQ